MLNKLTSKHQKNSKQLQKTSQSLSKNSNNKTNRKNTKKLEEKTLIPPTPKIISVLQLKSQPPKQRSKRQPQQQPQLLREFECITQIYNNSKDINNDEDDSLLCFENIEEGFGFIPRPPLSVANRYSSRASSQLPSITEKEEQHREDQIPKSQSRHKSTILTSHKTISHSTDCKRKKSSKSAKIHFPTQACLKSIEKVQKIKTTLNMQIKKKDINLQTKRMTVNVASLVKTKRKASSSMSDRSNKRK